MTENSAELAGGAAHGVFFEIQRADSGDIERLADVMLRTGIWVNEISGSFLGHVKMSADSNAKGAMTLNLTDLDTGVERHGSISFPSDMDVRFMAAVLDVDAKELANAMEKHLSEQGYKVSKSHSGNIIDIK